MTLLEAERRKCDFLERWTAELANLRVVWGRAEEQPLETFGVAIAKALAQPPAAVEWCLPARPGGWRVVLWVGPTAEPDRVAAAAAAQLAGEVARRAGGLPRRFARSARPRRASRAAPGMARKRPLG